MKNLKHLIICFLLSVASCSAFAQPENNNWCFGYNAGLNFSTNPPTFFEHNMQTWEGCASVSDTNGNLLFYTSGGIVWDRNNNIMSNGSGLSGNGPAGVPGQQNMGSSENGVTIVKSPSNSNQYYIFTTDALEDVVNNAYYSVVDMTLNGGLGDVVTSQKNISLADDIMEGITIAALAGCNGYWLILHKRLSPEYLSFKIDEFGVSISPIISTGLISSGSNDPQQAQMCVNPQSSVLARSTNKGIEMAFFNMTSGVLSGFKIIDHVPQAFGCPIFSPNGSKFYSCNSAGGVHQFDMSLLPDWTAIQNSKTMIAPSTFEGSFRRGPDGKIYGKNFGSNFIDLINHPDAQGLACGFVPAAIIFPSYVSDKTFSELGNEVMIHIFPTVEITEPDTLICRGHKIGLHAEASGGSSYLWNTGSTSASIETEGPGVYTVTATNYCSNAMDSIRVEEFECKCSPFIPNAFSPNGDGMNDALRVFLYCISMSNYQFTIYNRFGEKIFEARSPDEEWDGTFKGKPADSGAYFFALKYKDGGNQEVRVKGDITLIR